MTPGKRGAAKTTTQRADAKKTTKRDAARAPKPRDLSEYHAKRRVGATPEPAGVVGASAPGRLRFVVQKHDATRLHYDFRLELDGVLLSWAVPKGPSYDQAEKRLAMMTEDHPLEYAEFEGVIPEGNYGAGPVIVWDIGTYSAVEEMRAGLDKGKLLFDLRGHKLRGRWTLVKIKGESGKEWLLIKERDGLQRTGPDTFVEDSVFSGLTLEELMSGEHARHRVLEELAELGAKRKPLGARDVQPMLATAGAEPFTREGWLFELKYDGYRLLAGRDAGGVRLLSRNGRDLTGVFPDIARAVERLPYEHFVIDGEVVVHDDAGMPSFQLLQQRAQLHRAIDARRKSVEHPATLYCFDLLGFDEYDLRALPLIGRKELLREILPSAGTLRFSEHIEEQGTAFYESVARMGLEGIIAKKADGAYRGGRSKDWLKIKSDPTDEFVVVGWTAPGGSRSGFGALLLGAYEGDVLRFVGSVGTGFNEKQIRSFMKRLEASVIDQPAADGAPLSKEHTWVEPTIVVEVRYREMTDETLLRHPVFVGERDDKSPRDCMLPEHARVTQVVDESELGIDEAEEESVEPEIGSRVAFSSLDKPFWPADGYTKGDLIEYYRAVADWMLPYLRDRPAVLTRYPDGIEGKSFFQKDAPGFAPEWLRREKVWSEGSERELSYFVLDDVDSLLYVANSASIPIHVWASRVPALEQPDWCILDLDPKDAPFAHVIDIARGLKKLCDSIDLPAYVKTTGSTGLHVLIPLARRLTHDQSKQLGELIARAVVKRMPAIATVARNPAKRAGRVYVDFLQNGHGKLLVAPYSARPVPGALASTPLRWSEVKAGLSLADYTIKTLPRRLSRMKADPMLPVLDQEADLLGALGRLASLDR
ncbi:MAG TPA: DNA ligase D [Longimicrobiales bacterium]|nr:DNA ligase D [Longimicrobiales bacterium]